MRTSISQAQYEKNVAEQAKKDQAYREKLQKVPLRARIMQIQDSASGKVFITWETDNVHQLKPVRPRNQFWLYRDQIDCDELLVGVTGYLIPDGPSDGTVYRVGGHGRREQYSWSFIEDRSYETGCYGYHVKRPEVPADKPKGNSKK